MNVYTILGAALVDAEFSELLFKNPLAAAKKLGIVLTNFELDVLRAVLATEGLEDHFEAFSGKFCPRPPCPLAIAENCAPVGAVAAD